MPFECDKIDAGYAAEIINGNAWTTITIPLTKKTITAIKNVQITPLLSAYRIYAPTVVSATQNEVIINVYSNEAAEIGVGFYVIVYGI